MRKTFNILVINTGSTSTKIALFRNHRRIFQENIAHKPKDLTRFKKIADQKDFRKKLVLNILKKKSISLADINIIVGRGGLTKPITGGIYKINRRMYEDVKKTSIHGREHASSLGSIIAFDLAANLKIDAITMDPVATDEMNPIARISGFPGIERKSLFHALNIKAISRKSQRRLKLKKDAKFIIIHMGGGISIACSSGGRVIDVNNAVLGMGPFTPQRAGSLPTADLVNVCFSGKFKKDKLLKKLAKESGLMGYLGTDNVVKIESRIKSGDKLARLVFEAMVYQIAKEIGAYATVFKGRFDAIVFTGGLSRSKMLIRMLRDRVSFLGKILVFPGEEELNALAHAGLAVAQNKIKPKLYK